MQRPLKPLPGIRNIVAVGSAKGGVGKSTVAANLAAAWAAMGARVGLLDADVYGPSQPLMFGVAARSRETEGKRILPVTAHGVKLMSIGFLVDAGQPVIWRGPMVTQALNQLLTETDWGELDYLVRRPAARHRRPAADAGAEGAGGGQRGGHHAAGDRGGGRAQGHRRCSRRCPLPCSAWWRT